MFRNIGTQEIIVIGVVIMVLFFSNKLPEITRTLIESIRAFRKGLRGETDTKEKEQK